MAPTDFRQNERENSGENRRQLRKRITADLWHALLTYRGITLASFALMIVGKLAAVGMPLVLREIVDELGHPVSLALLPVFLVLAYALMRFLADALNEARDVVFSVVTQRTVASFTERTFAHLHRLGARFHAQRETGSVVRDVQKGADGIGFLLGTAIFAIVPTFVEIATIVVIIARGYSWGFTAVIALTFVCYAIYTYVFTQRRLAVQRRVNALEAQSDARLVDSMLNYDTVKFFATEHVETRRLTEVLEQWIDARIANQRALTTLHIGQSAVVAAGIAAMLLIAVQDVLLGRMTVGDLVLVNAYIVQVCMPLNTLGFVFRETNDAKVNVERMFGILAARGVQGEDVDLPQARPLVVTDGAIEFAHVDFAYDASRPVLHHVHFRVHPGHRLAVVGGSGSGKSTLVRLLFRLYQPGAGRVSIDGQDLREVTQKSVREAVGIVPQDTVLFNDTIAYNIAYGRPGATRADIVRAARAAQLDEFIERLPDHYDTRVGERGLRLSGGERQRIAIARAILKNPRIIVFDEATSALDTRSERAIQAELNRLAHGRTSVAIAHRLSTVVDADWILVMEHGRIVEQGAHDDLLARDGVYAKMWALQWQQGELEHMQRKVSAQAVELGPLVAAVGDDLRNEMARRRVRWHVSMPDGALCATGDRFDLKQIVASLCRNEIEHAGAGETVDVRVERRANHAWLSVSGARERPGEMPEEAARRIEAKLSALGGGFTATQVGKRVAYAAVIPLRPVVEASALEKYVTGVEAESDADAAANTANANTAQVQPADAEASQAVHPALLEEPLAGITVLALDDQEEARDALEAVLSASGAHVLLAESGDDVLQLLADTPKRTWPQVFLCDIVLGHEDGYEVLKRLRDLEAAQDAALDADRAAQHLPAIALTGYTEPSAGAAARALQEGFAAHLTKPVAAAVLIGTIRDVAHARRV
ncbi:ATP-binding cassette domain-containing protein [Paraburkholderia edwinii]|uniref:ATP-binding cassette domain-containing protein n=1 Tax=Paraburkholderia edwinii TaxID=2861782 RepID=A0ABX8UJ91_9BURK|nr:ATP-binding cassette domain-containing protein [Paraburkholderia edwinii]QYD67013.1 ATP-binding cassette domain-containing protein [Paraburkholderia edwinii]